MNARRNWKFIARLGLLALLGAVLAVCVYARVPCFFRRMTGLPCPACGMSRAWLAALRLDLAGALRYHPMFWCVPVLGLLWLYPGERLPRWGVVAGVLIAGGYFVCYVIRLVAFFRGFGWV